MVEADASYARPRWAFPVCALRARGHVAARVHACACICVSSPLVRRRLLSQTRVDFVALSPKARPGCQPTKFAHGACHRQNKTTHANSRVQPEVEPASRNAKDVVPPCACRSAFARACLCGTSRASPADARRLCSSAAFTERAPRLPTNQVRTWRPPPAKQKNTRELSCATQGGTGEPQHIGRKNSHKCTSALCAISSGDNNLQTSLMQ